MSCVNVKEAKTSTDFTIFRIFGHHQAYFWI